MMIDIMIMILKHEKLIMEKSLINLTWHIEKNK